MKTVYATTKKTTKKQINELRSQGHTNETIYEITVGKLGLYYIAFFGYKGTRNQKRQLNNLWKRIINN